MEDQYYLVSDDEDEDLEAIVMAGDLAAGENEEAESHQQLEHGRQDDSGSREALKVTLAKLDSEIKSVKAQLEPLQTLYTSLLSERKALEMQLSSLAHLSRGYPATKPTMSRQSHKSAAIDYQSSSFPWSDAILSTLQKTFRLPSFRLCQEGVINAAMDDRDIVCVMPTGGGKSLTYQLPAIIGGKGLTVVISPLLALIWDQVRSLKELGVECVMLTGSTSKDEQNAAYRRMEEGAGRNGKEIRLCYVTPEKIAKSKRFMSVLEKVNQTGRLTRFVIDEAHCCSQLGHDFRPDYKKLSVLKTLFPRVPIQAVTATLSSKTLPDLLKILRLAPISDGRAANSSGTIFFSAPLYRPNLLYQVQAKPSSAKATIEKMGSWIQEHHNGDSGIIYCLSKKDAETVADELRSWSNGELKTGVYHAGVDEYAKEKIHTDWRKGRVNCICATIAFGLGIDKGDVRYVIHHSMSKSLEGYYQETGRAGRDGQNSDCVLFYRGQDSARLASLVYSDVDGVGKLREMVRFAQELKTCRKVAFAKYFSTSAQLSTNAWDNPDSLGAASSSNAVSACGQCDNCRRPPESVVTRDVTLESWKVLKVLEEVQSAGGRVTLANLADLVRGLGGGSFGVVDEGHGRKRKAKLAAEKGSLDVQAIAGGKVELNKEETEALLIHLTLLGYLEDSYHATAYAVNVYLATSSRSIRLSRLTQSDVESGASGIQIECTFLNPKAKVKAKTKAKAKKAKAEDAESEEDEAAAKKPKRGKAKGSAGKPVVNTSMKDEFGAIEEVDEGDMAVGEGESDEDELSDGWGHERHDGWLIPGAKGNSKAGRGKQVEQKSRSNNIVEVSE